MIHLPPGLALIHNSIKAEGFDMRDVGGFVRDGLCGVTAKDRDLCTDAFPDEQISIYKKNNIRYALTGYEHGTITVIPAEGEVYEITSLREDVETDGRRAVVRYTRLWETDQARRDLTINSIARDMEGRIYDPFGGVEDLKAGRVRFVGDPAQRMQEDYLRILRWLRFHARYAGAKHLDQDAVDAAIQYGSGLQKISAERIWMEMSKIFAGPRAPYIIKALMRMGLAPHIRMPHGSIRELEQAIGSGATEAIPRLVAFIIDPTQIRNLAETWKMSAEERIVATFLADNLMDDEADLVRMMAVGGIRQDRVIELAVLQGRYHVRLERPVPVFPIKGQDLLDRGMKPGKEVGYLLAALKDRWADSGYKMTQEELLEGVSL